MHTERGEGNESSQIPPIASWEGKAVLTQESGGHSKPIWGTIIGAWGFARAFKIVSKSWALRVKGCPPISEGQQILLPLLRPREGRALGSLPWHSLAGSHGYLGTGAAGLGREPLTSLHNGRLGGGIFQDGLTLTPKGEKIRGGRRDGDS